MLRPRMHIVTALLLLCGVVCVRIRLEATSGTASAVLNRLDAYDFCCNHLLVECSGCAMGVEDEDAMTVQDHEL